MMRILGALQRNRELHDRRFATPINVLWAGSQRNAPTNTVARLIHIGSHFISRKEVLHPISCDRGPPNRRQFRQLGPHKYNDLPKEFS